MLVILKKKNCIRIPVDCAIQYIPSDQNVYIKKLSLLYISNIGYFNQCIDRFIFFIFYIFFCKIILIIIDINSLMVLVQVRFTVRIIIGYNNNLIYCLGVI